MHLMPPINHKFCSRLQKRNSACWRWLTISTLILSAFCSAGNVAEERRNQVIFTWKHIKCSKHKAFEEKYWRNYYYYYCYWHVSKLLTPTTSQVDSFYSQGKERIRLDEIPCIPLYQFCSSENVGGKLLVLRPICCLQHLSACLINVNYPQLQRF